MNSKSNFKIIALVAAFAVTLPITEFGSTAASAQDPLLKKSQTKDGTFMYPPEWGTINITKTKDNPLIDKGDIPDGVAPAHIECRFSKSKATIYIYPIKDAGTADFKKKYEAIADATNDLKKLLKEHPAAPKTIPYLPWADAGDPTNAQVKYVSGKDRSAVRFLTQQTADATEFNNTDLLYSNQSLTTDGKSFIAAWLPVAAEGLPAKDGASQMKPDKYKQFTLDYPSYAKKMLKKLNALTDAQFKLPLSTLDKISEGIWVQ